MEAHQKMTFKRIAWSDGAEKYLRRSLKDDAAFIREEVTRGRARLWSINDGESFLVTRCEFPELVVVCYEGFDVLAMSRIVVKRATELGYQSIRFHTQSLALLRLLRPLNPEPIEYVMRVKTNGRRQ